MLCEVPLWGNGSGSKDSGDTRCSDSVDLVSNEVENTERAVVTKVEIASVSPELLKGTGKSLKNTDTAWRWG